jgi:hypothetical protein
VTIAATHNDLASTRPGGKLSGRQPLGIVIRVAFSVALLAAALYFAPEKLEWRQLLAVSPASIGLCLVLSGLLVWLLAWRWQLLVSMRNGDGASTPGLGSFIRATWLALAVNQVLPSVVGGDVLRISMLARRGVPLLKAGESVVMDRIYGLAALALICLATWPVIGMALSGPAMLALAALVAAALAVLAIVLAGDRFRELCRSFWPMLSFRRGGLLLLLAVAGHAANIAIFLIMAQGLGIDLPIMPTVAIMSGVLLTSVLPFSIAGWGIREFTLVQAFDSMGIYQDKIVLASIAYGLLLLATQAGGFLLLAWRSRP